MGKAAFSWSVPPDVMADDINRWQERIVAALGALFGAYGARVVSHAMQHAPWTDRTANARQGLSSRTEIEASSLAIVLFHTMDYGIYLETKYGGKWGIILDTIEAMYPALFAAVRALLI